MDYINHHPGSFVSFDLPSGDESPSWGSDSGARGGGVYAGDRPLRSEIDVIFMDLRG